MSDLEKRITAKMILDDSGYSSTLKGINATLRENKSELKAASTGLDAFGKTTQNVERVQKAFKEQLETQSKKVQVYKDSLKKATNTLEKNVVTREKLTRSITQEEAKLDALKKNYGENNEAVRNVKVRLEEMREQLEKVDSSIENNSKRIQSYSTQLNNAESELNKATVASKKFNDDLVKSKGLKTTSQKLEETSRKFKKFSKGAEKVGSALNTNVSLPLTGVAAAAGYVGMEFEAEMSRVKAISGATGKEFDKLSAQALKLGQDTAFSAGECAEGMENLASAGFDVNEITEAMPGLLDLAASSGENLAMSSDIAASTLRGFGIEASKTGHVADVLAKNAAATNAAVADTGEAMKYIAPVAHAMGLSLEEVTASIGIMSNAGIKGSQAGTTLRGALTRLAKPSDIAAGKMKSIGFNAFDSSGKLKGLSTITSELAYCTRNMTDEQKQATVAQIFGQEAMSGMLVLMQSGKEGLDNLTGELKNCDGAAKEMATTMQDNAKSSIEQAMGALETAGIKTLRAATPMIKKVSEVVGNLADKFSALSPQTQEFIVTAGMMAIATGPVVSGVGKITTCVGGLISIGSKLSSGLSLISTGAEVTGVATTGLATAAEGSAIATGAASIATTGLGATLLSAAAPIAIGVGAITAVGYACYKTAKYLKEDATPAVDLFADKAVYSTKTIATAHGTMTTQVQTDTIKISESTKESVQSYLDMDKKASDSLMSLKMNSDKFTKEAKDTVLKNFEEMSKKSSTLTEEQRNSMTVSFKKLVSDTGTLTQKNKDEIIKRYTAMVNGTKNLTEQQKQQTIKNFTDTLNQSVGLTKKQSTELQKIYKDMGEKIKAGMDKKRNEELKKQQDFFSKSNALTEKEEAEAIKKTGEFWEKQKAKIDEGQKRIKMIYEKAAEEHRQITDDEFKAISSIQHSMKEDAVKTLSENEVQAKVILERMKGNDEHITAEQASEHIKELNKSRDEAIKAANEECDKRIAEIVRMRDETGALTAEQADKCISDAKRQKDETINAAEETRNQAVDKISSMSSDIKRDVNTTTGDIKGNLEKIKDWWDGWNPVRKVLEIFTKHTNDGKSADENWTGNSYFKGGFTTLHERGYELYDLPSGSRIYNHESSEAMVLETAKQTAQIVAESMLGSEGGSNGDIIIPISIAGEEIDRIVVPRVSNKLAQNIRGRFHIGGKKKEKLHWPLKDWSA